MIRLYSASASDFIQTCKTNQIGLVLETNFLKYLGRKPQIPELMAFQNSLPRMKDQLEELKWKNAGVIVEYQMPSYGGRVDFMVFGKTNQGKDTGVLIELKQWQKAEASELNSDKLVTWTGGGKREVLHPSVQAYNYKEYLKQNLSPFYEENPILLNGCSYLHNYRREEDDILFDPRFLRVLHDVPCYTSDTDDYYNLNYFLTTHIDVPEGESSLKRILNGDKRPSKKLMVHVSETIKDGLKNPDIGKLLGSIGEVPNDYVLLDDQIVVFEIVFGLAKQKRKKKQIVLVHGGPGTGKSVISLQLLAKLHAEGFNAEYATGSNSFTETIRSLVGGGNKQFFKYFMSYGAYEENHLDVLILDEAHRIREKTGYPFKSTGRPQIMDIIRSSKTLVFFLDDKQVVRPGEIGSSTQIKQTAIENGYDLHEVHLKAQFRCAGSDGFINWVSDVLGIEETANPMWIKDPDFSFEIVSDVNELDAKIRAQVRTQCTGRLMAGYCWDWTKDPDENGQLKSDVKIGDFERPWNAHNDAKGLARDVPKASFWAFQPGGIDQVGCIYTAQGFEFDYAGIIFGNDLVYRFDLGKWIVIRENCKDPMVKKEQDDEKLASYLKNTYRVLLTRAQKGCYVYFLDSETEKFIKSRMR